MGLSEYGFNVVLEPVTVPAYSVTNPILSVAANELISIETFDPFAAGHPVVDKV